MSKKRKRRKKRQYHWIESGGEVRKREEKRSHKRKNKTKQTKRQEEELVGPAGTMIETLVWSDSGPELL